MKHYRCPHCGMLYTDRQPYADEIWCTHTGKVVYRGPWEESADWTLMEQFDPSSLERQLEAANNLNRELRQRNERNLARVRELEVTLALRKF